MFGSSPKVAAACVSAAGSPDLRSSRPVLDAASNEGRDSDSCVAATRYLLMPGSRLPSKWLFAVTGAWVVIALATALGA